MLRRNRRNRVKNPRKSKLRTAKRTKINQNFFFFLSHFIYKNQYKKEGKLIQKVINEEIIEKHIRLTCIGENT